MLKELVAMAGQTDPKVHVLNPNPNPP